MESVPQAPRKHYLPQVSVMTLIMVSFNELRAGNDAIGGVVQEAHACVQQFIRWVVFKAAHLGAPYLLQLGKSSESKIRNKSETPPSCRPTEMDPGLLSAASPVQVAAQELRNASMALQAKSMNTSATGPYFRIPF